MRWFKAVVGVLFLVAVFAFPAMSGDPDKPYDLRVQYIEFPPYYFTDSDGRPDGFLLKFALRAFERAGLRVLCESLPAKRVLSNLHSEEPVASPGWFKTPEREQFARFSRPIHQNKQLVAVYLEKYAPRFEGRDSLGDLLKDRQLRLGLVEGYSLGLVADTIIAEALTDAVRVVGGYSRMLRMLAEERFLFMLMSPEEIAPLIRKNHLNPAIFVTRPLSDLPAGNRRYIIYSQGVSEALIRRIDKALTSLLKEQESR
ncbi:MAG: transporter substrate-binding domain-containing protein [Pseudodesulfovibrio sp.]